jgi:hypothetical protein
MRAQWDLVAAKPTRVAAAVKRFVVMQDIFGSRGEARNADDHAVANDRLAAHDCQLLLVQPRGLQENRIRHADFANIVEQRSARHVFELGLASAQPTAKQFGIAADPLRMNFGLLVTRVERSGERK